MSHPKNDFEGNRSHNPTKLLCLSAKKQCTREITSVTDSSSYEDLNRPGTFWPNHTTATPTPWDDSSVDTFHAVGKCVAGGQ